VDECKQKEHKFTVEKALARNQVSLTVNRVTLNDSAIYICGIAFPSAKQTGGGTTLVVRGQSIKALVWHITTFSSDL
jgi:hypothetical protein